MAKGTSEAAQHGAAGRAEQQDVAGRAGQQDVAERTGQQGAAAPATPAGSEHDHGCACGQGAHDALERPPEGMPDEELLYDLADLFKVFGDTTRIKILYALMGSALCVADVAELIGATQSAVSHQLRTLKQARLVKFQRDGKNVIYSLSDDHVYTMLAQGMTHICE